jgi:hypothetical protein
VFTALQFVFPVLQSNPGWLLWGPLLAFFSAALVLSIIPRTSGLGGGLLMSIGIFLIVGAGLCVAVFSAVAGA